METLLSESCSFQKYSKAKVIAIMKLEIWCFFLGGGYIKAMLKLIKFSIKGFDFFLKLQMKCICVFSFHLSLVDFQIFITTIPIIVLLICNYNIFGQKYLSYLYCQYYNLTLLKGARKTQQNYKYDALFPVINLFDI